MQVQLEVLIILIPSMLSYGELTLFYNLVLVMNMNYEKYISFDVLLILF